MNAPQVTGALTTRTIKAGSRQIFVAERGQGPVVLMLHGGGPGASGLSNYARNVEALSLHYRVIVPDMPGYGRSSKGLDRSDPFGDLAASMLALLDALGIERAHVVGNSLGGACAVRMAMERSRSVGRLILMGPGGVDTTRRPPTAGLKSLLNYYRGEGPTLDKLTTFIRQYLVHDSSRVSDAVISERFNASIDPEVVAHPPLLRPKLITNFRKLDFTRDKRLSSVQNPTLVLWGTEDKVNRPSGAQSLQTRLPNCDVYLFSKTGHWVQWERADDFNAVVLAFLAQDPIYARARAAD